jgi:predicted RNase H-like HicB family nuclease
MQSYLERFVTFTAILQRTAEGYVGFIAELPGATSSGATLAETRENLIEAARLAIETSREAAEASVRGLKVIREQIEPKIL